MSGAGGELAQRILVCGSRHLQGGDYFKVLIALFEYGCSGTTVISGGAAGIDACADAAARAIGLKSLVFPADWAAHGRAAGPIRNKRMLDEGRPDLVLAFPGGLGTADMVSRARRAGIRVVFPG